MISDRAWQASPPDLQAAVRCRRARSLKAAEIFWAHEFIASVPLTALANFATCALRRTMGAAILRAIRRTPLQVPAITVRQHRSSSQANGAPLFPVSAARSVPIRSSTEVGEITQRWRSCGPPLSSALERRARTGSKGQIPWGPRKGTSYGNIARRPRLLGFTAEARVLFWVPICRHFVSQREECRTLRRFGILIRVPSARMER